MKPQFTPGQSVSVTVSGNITKYGSVQRLTENTVYVKHFNGSVVGYKPELVTATVIAEQQQRPYGVGLSNEISAIQSIMEKTLTPAEKKKREEVAQAIERDNPDMPMDKKMAIATATAKKVAEDVEQIDELKSSTLKRYINKAEDSYANTTDAKTKAKRDAGLDRADRKLETKANSGNPFKEEAEQTHPKTDKEKALAKLAPPHDKITHADVLTGRGVKKEEAGENLPGQATHLTNKDLRQPGSEYGIISRGTTLRHLGGNKYEVRAGRARGKHMNIDSEHVQKLAMEEDHYNSVFREEKIPTDWMGVPTKLPKGAKPIKPPAGYHDYIKHGVKYGFQDDPNHPLRKKPKSDKSMVSESDEIELTEEDIADIDAFLQSEQAEQAELDEAVHSPFRKAAIELRNKSMDPAHSDDDRAAYGMHATLLASKDPKDHQASANAVRGHDTYLRDAVSDAVHQNSSKANSAQYHKMADMRRLREENELDEARLMVSRHRNFDFGDGPQAHEITKDHGTASDGSRVYSVKQPNGFHGVLAVKDGAVVGSTHKNHTQAEAHKIGAHYAKHGTVGIGVGSVWSLGSGIHGKVVKESLDESMISYSDFTSKLAAHKKAGNKIKDDKYGDKKASYIVIDQDGVGKKITHTAAGTTQQHLGQVEKVGDDSQATEKRGRGRPAGSKSGARN